MAKIVFDVVATMGEYTNASGEKKKRYQNVGKVFENDKGKLSIKLEVIPVGPDWSGWLSLYPPKDGQQSAPRSTPVPVKADFSDLDDDIPF